MDSAYRYPVFSQPSTNFETAVSSEERGGSARLTVFEGVGHDSWERAYAGSALVDWLLSHRKG